MNEEIQIKQLVSLSATNNELSLKIVKNWVAEKFRNKEFELVFDFIFSAMQNKKKQVNKLVIDYVLDNVKYCENNEKMLFLDKYFTNSICYYNKKHIFNFVKTTFEEILNNDDDLEFVKKVCPKITKSKYGASKEENFEFLDCVLNKFLKKEKLDEKDLEMITFAFKKHDYKSFYFKFINKVKFSQLENIDKSELKKFEKYVCNNMNLVELVGTSKIDWFDKNIPLKLLFQIKYVDSLASFIENCKGGIDLNEFYNNYVKLKNSNRNISFDGGTMWKVRTAINRYIDRCEPSCNLFKASNHK